MTNYPGADTTTQWFQDDYPGALMHPNVIVIHTTETPGWPGYDGGKTAPNLTARPDTKAQRLGLRQHFPLERSSRALRNLAGGVETNTLNAIQLELVGTCDPKHAKSWNGEGKLFAGRDYIFWPAAPAWALRELGTILANLHRLFPAIPLTAPVQSRWLAYPSSYGNKNGQRMSNAGWQAFKGICGHQHVPENTHGDPGNLDITKVLTYAAPPAAAVKPPAAPVNTNTQWSRHRRTILAAIASAAAAIPKSRYLVHGALKTARVAISATKKY